MSRPWMGYLAGAAFALSAAGAATAYAQAAPVYAASEAAAPPPPIVAAPAAYPDMAAQPSGSESPSPESAS